LHAPDLIISRAPHINEKRWSEPFEKRIPP
jgi:hypothetical protein